MSRNLQSLVLAVLCGWLAGCASTTSKSIVHFGIRGRLVDAASGRAIAGARISIILDAREFDRTTNRRGEFSLEPEVEHFWYHQNDAAWPSNTRAIVGLAYNDYLPYLREFVVRPEVADVPPPDANRLNGNWVELGDVLIRRR